MQQIYLIFQRLFLRSVEIGILKQETTHGLIILQNSPSFKHTTSNCLSEAFYAGKSKLEIEKLKNFETVSFGRESGPHGQIRLRYEESK